MGQTTHQIAVKRLKNTQPGELIRYQFGDGTALAIVIELGPEEVKLAYLGGAGAFAPFWTWHHNLEQRCISFGADWVVEPVSASMLFADQGDAPSGSLAVTSHGLALRLRPDRGQQGTITVRIDNMGQLTAENFDHICEWRLWFTSRDRETAQGQPAFVFGV